MSEVYSSGSWTDKEGEEEAFVKAWTEFAGWLKTMEGAGTARLTRDITEPRQFHSFAPWKSLEAMHAWKQNPEFSDRMGRVQAHVAAFEPAELELVAEV